MFESLWRRSGRTVLIVSENSAEPVLDSPFLHQPDIRLITSYPDDEGLRLARRERPSLIIEELDACNGEALEFCEKLRAHRSTRSIPLIVVTSSSNRERAERARADALLEKPLRRRELYEAVCRFLSLPRRRVDRIITNLRFTFWVDDHRYQAFSRDVSEQGAFLKTDRVPGLGQRIELRFRLPGCSSEVRCVGVVRNTTCGEHHQLGGVGVEFREMSEADQERLETFIESQVQRRRF